MRIERVFLEKITTVRLNIGYVGEHDHCRVVIDSGSLLHFYPNAVASMTVKPPVGDAYPVVLTQSGDDVIWNVSDSDLAHPGGGTFQLTFSLNGEIIKTAIGSFSVDASIIGTGEAPDPVQDWIEEATEALRGVSEAVNDAETAAESANEAAELANTNAVLAGENAVLAEEAAESASSAATLANEKAALANEKAALANEKAALANEKAILADTKATLADTAASAANAAATKIDGMTVSAIGLPSGYSPTATISEVEGHKHIAFGLVKGDKGKDFRIRKTFVSIAAMEAYDPDEDQSASKVLEYDFVMIDTGNVEDVDTGKLFCYEPQEQNVWHYIGDLSGKQGIKGETGTGIDYIVMNSDYTLTIYLDDGTHYTTTSIRGATGVGIASVTLNQNYTLTITYTDGTSTTTSSVRGATGETPDISIGTVETLYPNQSAYVELDSSSTPEAPVLNFGIPKGDTGVVENMYATTLPFSPQDATKTDVVIGRKTDKVSNAVTGNFAGLDANGNLTDSGHKHSDYLTQHQDISGKLDKDQGSSNAGKFMKVGDTGILTPATVPSPEGKADKVSGAVSGNFAGLDANGNLTDSGHKHSDYLTQHQDISGKVDKDQGTGNAGKVLGIGNTGMVTPVPFTMDEFTGATSSTNGVKGLVPAPQAGDQGKYLKGDGTWGVLAGDDFTGATATTNGVHGYVPAPLAGEQEKVLYGNGDWDVAPGARIIQVTTTVTNTSGSYTTTISDDRVSADMKALSLEIANPYIFNEKITVTCSAGSVTLSCNDVEGTSAVTINIIKAALNTASITSEEFDILDAAKVDKADFYATEMQMSSTDDTTVQEAISDIEATISNMNTGVFVVTLDAVSNVSGSYTHTTTVSGMTGDLKCVELECSDPTVFRAPVSIVTGSNSVTLTCSNVVGSSTVKASFLAVGNGNPLSSSEYAALDTRIGQLADLDTTDKSSVVDAINELNNNGTGHGSNNNGEYWKFPDGTLICAKHVNTPTVTFEAWGSLYESSTISFGDWPYEFKTGTIPIIHISLRNSNATGLISGAGNVTATSAGVGRVYRPVSTVSTSFSMDVVGYGTWK